MLFPTQPKILHIPGHSNSSDIVLPFRTKLKWYPTCLLKFITLNGLQTADILNQAYPLYPTFVVYLTTIGGGCLLCRTSLLCTIYSLLKNLLGNLYNLHSVGIFTTPMFYKYTIIFFNYQIFLKLFFNPIARVSFITYKVLHPLINVRYERFFKLPNYFIRLSGFVCIHTFGFINVGFNSNKLKIR